MNINIWAVLVSAVASMVIGSIWFGPLFGKRYIEAMGWANNTPEQSKQMMKDMQLSYLWQFLASVVSFFILAVFIRNFYDHGAASGIKIALLGWLGFIVPMKFGDILWGGKKILFWLSMGSSFLTYLVAGAIIGGWR